MDTVQTQYPVMPLKNTVLFPQQVIPIYVGRKKSLQLIDDLEIFLRRFYQLLEGL